MFYVYVLRSQADARQTYIGSTENLRQRFTDHNAGKSRHTAKYMPWDIACYFAFPDKMRAYAFEAYLKSHSGRAFGRKRLY